MHPYAKHKEKHPGKARVSKMYGTFKDGGKVHGDEAEDRVLIHKEIKKAMHTDHKATGGPAAPRLDKHARGGKVKHGAKHHTKINIMVAPKGGPDPGAGAMVSPPGGPPPGMPPGGPPPGAMAGPPPGAGGLPGAGPGLPPPPGGMKRGGTAKHKSGLSSPSNIKKWGKEAKSNTRYEKGGKVPMKAGAYTGEGRLEKIKDYGMKRGKN